MEKRPEPTLSAVYFKQVSDDIWMHHDGGRSSYAAAPADLGVEELGAFNETLASIDKSLVLAGPLARRALHLVSVGGEKVELDARGLVDPVEGGVETFHRDTAGEWFREINVSFNFGAEEGLLRAEYCMGRSSMKQDASSLLLASAHLSSSAEPAYEGEEVVRYELETQDEMALLETIATMARLPIAGGLSEAE